MIYPYVLVGIVIDLLFNLGEELFPKGWPESLLALLTRYNADDTISQTIYMKNQNWRKRER